jgi:O-antigen ligase
VTTVAAHSYGAVPTPVAGAPPATDYPPVALALTAGFGLYILVWFLEFGQRVAVFGAMRLEFLLGAFLSAAAVISISAREESNRSRLTKFICAYFIFLLLHLLVSRYIAISWNAFVDWILKFSCMALFIYAFVRSPRTLRIFMAMLLLVVLKLGSEAFIGKITGSMVWENQGIPRLHGTPGLRFGHPNSLSGLGVSMLPFLYYMLPVVPRRWRPVLLVTILFAGNIILFTGSRTGYLATLALAGFLWLRSTRKGRFFAVLLIIATAGVPAIPPHYESRFMSAFVGQEAEGRSKEARIELVNDAWRLFLENPQGLGIYAFRYTLEDELGKEQYDPHNLYLQMLVEIGVLGSLLFTLLIWAVWRELRSTEMDLADSERQLTTVVCETPEAKERLKRHIADVRFMRGTASAFLAFIFTRLILGVFGHDLYEIYWWLASGASIAIVNMKPVADARTAAILASCAPSRAAGTTGPAVSHLCQ